jgi:diacylglycerol kinase (ATP)
MFAVLLSLKNALIGLLFCFRTQRNMIIHTVIGFIVILIAVILKVPDTKLLFLLTAIAVVLVAEAMNTALEKTIDLYTKKRNYLAQTAKDVAAGAVLLSVLFAVTVGIIVLGPPLWSMIRFLL